MRAIIDDFRNKLKNQFTLGCFSKTTDSSVIESIGIAGWDYVIIDMEHGPITTETLKHHVMAAQSGGVLPIVRVDGFNSPNIGKALDLGAGGIQVPSVNSGQQVKEILKKSKFHPIGERGVCRFVKAADYGMMTKSEYFKIANEALLILQLEGKQGLENVNEIIDIGGFDVLFIGPYDLSQSLGVPGDIENKIVTDEIKRITNLALEKEIFVGTFCDTTEQLNTWKQAGMKYLSYSVDINILSSAMADIKEIAYSN